MDYSSLNRWTISHLFSRLKYHPQRGYRKFMSWRLWVDIFSEKEYFGHGNFIAYLNYWWLWLYTQDMHKKKKSQNPSTVCGVAHEAAPLDWNYWWLFTPKAWIVCCLNKGTQTITNNSTNQVSLLNLCLFIFFLNILSPPGAFRWSCSYRLH